MLVAKCMSGGSFSNFDSFSNDLDGFVLVYFEWFPFILLVLCLETDVTRS